MKRANVTYFLDGAHNIDSMEVQGWGRVGVGRVGWGGGEAGWGRVGQVSVNVCLCHGVTLCLIVRLATGGLKKQASGRLRQSGFCTCSCALCPQTPCSDDSLPCVCVSGRQGCTVCWCST